MEEDHTFESTLQRMVVRVLEQNPEIDTREGSIIYNALAPAAAELTQAYIELDAVTNKISPDTAVDDELEELCYQIGVFKKGATKAVRKGVFNKEVPLNSRFSGESNTYVVLENISGFEYKLESEQSGEIGNEYSGPIIPIDHIDGLTSALLTDVIVPGVEEESNEQLRDRYRKRLINPSEDGNVAQYLEWAESYEGVGVAKVFPLWNGGNTVKVAITDRLFQVADSTLVHSFQEYLDPGSEGLGNGVAPVGAKVTVTGGIKKDINITGDVILAEGYMEPEGVSETISAYLASITFVKNSVSYMRTGVAIIDTPSIADLKNLTINGGATDVPLVGEENPILNSLNLTVVVE